MSKIYCSRGARRKRLVALLHGNTRWWVLIGIGTLLLAVAGTAAAAIVLTGKGTLTAPAYTEQTLQVSGERLSGPLTPGTAADLLFTVRNPNAFPARVNRVSLASPLRKAKPAGCTAKVGGPVTRTAGAELAAAEQVTVPAGDQAQVTVRGAFRLAAGAGKGCGFTVDILINATQIDAAQPEDTPAADPVDSAEPAPPLDDPAPSPTPELETTSTPEPASSDTVEDAAQLPPLPPAALIP